MDVVIGDEHAVSGNGDTVAAANKPAAHSVVAMVVLVAVVLGGNITDISCCGIVVCSIFARFSAAAAQRSRGWLPSRLSMVSSTELSTASLRSIVKN